MSFQVLSPQYDNVKKCYVFTFKNAPKIEEITTDPSRLNITEEDLTELFLRDFLEQASKYFSKALDISAFLKRLTYEWNTEEVEQKEGESFRATWIPARVVFYTGRYEIHWNLVEMEVEKPKIPSGFMDGLPDLQEVGGIIPFEDPAAEEQPGCGGAAAASRASAGIRGAPTAPRRSTASVPWARRPSGMATRW
jgi:hypothetical protein